MNKTKQQGRQILDASMPRVQALIDAGVDPQAVVAGLLAMTSEVACAVMGPAEAARLLRLTALDIDKGLNHDAH